MSDNLSEQWVQYNKATGAIVGTITATSDVIGWQGDTFGHIKDSQQVDAKNHYIDLSDLQIKTRQDYVYSSIPYPCLIYIDEIEYLSSTAPAITFAEDGVYEVSVKPMTITSVCKIFKVSQQASVISVLSEEVINANFPL